MVAARLVVLGPGGLNDQAHQIDESVGLAELTTAARTFALLCLRSLRHTVDDMPDSKNSLLEGERP